MADGVAVARPLATDVAAFSHDLFLNGTAGSPDILRAVVLWLAK